MTLLFSPAVVCLTVSVASVKVSKSGGFVSYRHGSWGSRGTRVGLLSKGNKRISFNPIWLLCFNLGKLVFSSNNFYSMSSLLFSSVLWEMILSKVSWIISSWTGFSSTISTFYFLLGDGEWSFTILSAGCIESGFSSSIMLE